MLSACEEDPGTPARLGTNLWPGYEPLYLARELGLLDPDKVRLVEQVSTSEVIKGLANGSLDAAALTLDEAIGAYHRGIDLRVVLVTDTSVGGDVILAKPGIESMADLKGRTIGVEETALGAFMLARATAFAGMQRDAVDVRLLELNEHAAAMRDGRIDAVVTFDPVRSDLLADGFIEVFSSKQIPGEIVDVVTVTPEVLEQRPDVIEHLLEAWFEANAEFVKNPIPSAEIMDRRLKIGSAEVLASFDGLVIPDKSDVALLFQDRGAKFLELARRIQVVMLDAGILDLEADLQPLFSTPPDFFAHDG